MEWRGGGEQLICTYIVDNGDNKYLPSSYQWKGPPIWNLKYSDIYLSIILCSFQDKNYVLLKLYR